MFRSQENNQYVDTERILSSAKCRIMNSIASLPNIASQCFSEWMIREFVMRDEPEDMVACMDQFGFVPVSLDNLLQSHADIECMDDMLRVLYQTGLVSENVTRNAIANPHEWSLQNLLTHEKEIASSSHDDKDLVDPLWIKCMSIAHAEEAEKIRIREKQNEEERRREAKNLERRRNMENELNEINKYNIPDQLRPFYVPEMTTRKEYIGMIDFEGSNTSPEYACDCNFDDE